MKKTGADLWEQRAFVQKQRLNMNMLSDVTYSQIERFIVIIQATKEIKTCWESSDSYSAGLVVQHPMTSFYLEEKHGL